MLLITRVLKSFFLITVLIFTFKCESSASEVIGAIDWASQHDKKFYIVGWACQQKYSDSISVNIFANDNNDISYYLKSVTAKVEAEDAIQEKCASSETNYRFRTWLTASEFSRYQNHSIIAYGISPDYSGNAILTNSGKFKIQKKVVQAGDELFKFSYADALNQRWSNSPLLLSLADKGTRENVLSVAYEPYKYGSKRVAEIFSLNKRVQKATLSYNVYFDPDFEFVRSGKLHGLGGGKATSGCAKAVKDGWSVRVAFGGKGQAYLYIYQQGRKTRCGQPVYSKDDFLFKKGKWYHIDLYVQMNSSVNDADGRAALYVDGVKLAEQDGLMLSGDDKVDIESFIFSTFHGGSSEKFSPSKTVHAYFDNFVVKEGEEILSNNFGD